MASAAASAACHLAAAAKKHLLYKLPMSNHVFYVIVFYAILPAVIFQKQC